MESKARAFIDRLKAEGIYVQVGRDGLNLIGPGEAARGARAVLDRHPPLADEVAAILNPTAEAMKEWLALQGDEIRAEHAARTERLQAAGIPEAEAVALRTTYKDALDILPERLKPINGKLEGGEANGNCLG